MTITEKLEKSSFIYTLHDYSKQMGTRAYQLDRSSLGGEVGARLMYAAQLATSLVAIPLILLLGSAAAAFQLFQCKGAEAKSTLQATMASLTGHLFLFIPSSILEVCTTKTIAKESNHFLGSISEKIAQLWECSCCQSADDTPSPSPSPICNEKHFAYRASNAHARIRPLRGQSTKANCSTSQAASFRSSQQANLAAHFASVDSDHEASVESDDESIDRMPKAAQHAPTYFRAPMPRNNLTAGPRLPLSQFAHQNPYDFGDESDSDSGASPLPVLFVAKKR